DYSNISTQVRFAAPGTAIISSAGKTYKAFSGTSMAAPHVAGAFALLREKYSKMSLKLLEAKLDSSNRIVEDQKTGSYFKVLALKDTGEPRPADGSGQPNLAVPAGGERPQANVNTQNSEAPVPLPATGSVIVKMPSRS